MSADLPSIHRLTFINPNSCMICNKYVLEQCKMILMGRLEGWMYCSDCAKTKKVHAAIKAYLNSSKDIPCNWIFKSNHPSLLVPHPGGLDATIPQTEIKKSKGKSRARLIRHVHFFRDSCRNTEKPIHSGAIDWLDDWFKISVFAQKNMYGMDLTFVDHNTGEPCRRFVSLANIFANTPGFHTELVSCEDLFANEDVKIAFSDLAPDVIEAVQKNYETSINTPRTAHQF